MKKMILIFLLFFIFIGMYSYPVRAGGIGYDEGMQMVKDYIRSKELGRAEGVLREMLNQYPDNSELLGILARVLYWQKKYDESIRVYRRLLEVRPSEETEREMEKVILSKELHEIEGLIDRGEYGEAERRLKALYESGRDRYGTGYRLGMLYIRQRRYDDALKIFTELKTLYPEDKGFEELYIESLILNGDIKKAKETLYNLSDERRKEIYRSRDDLFYRVRRNSLLIKAEFYDYTLGIEDEEKYTVQISQRLFEKTFVLSYADIDRFGMRDTQMGLDIYSKLGEKTKRWGYISFTFSPDPDFLARWSFGGAVYQGYGNFDFSLGYTHTEFKDSSVDRFTPAIFYYMPRAITLSETIFINPDKETLTFLSKIHYEPNHRFNCFYSFAIGQSAVEIGATQDIERIDQYSHKVGLEYRPFAPFSIGGEYYYSHRSGSYDKEGFSIMVRLWW